MPIEHTKHATIKEESHNQIRHLCYNSSIQELPNFTNTMENNNQIKKEMIRILESYNINEDEKEES